MHFGRAEKERSIEKQNKATKKLKNLTCFLGKPVKSRKPGFVMTDCEARLLMLAEAETFLRSLGGLERPSVDLRFKIRQTPKHQFVYK